MVLERNDKTGEHSHSSRQSRAAAVRLFDGAVGDDARRDAAVMVIANTPNFPDLVRECGEAKTREIWLAAGRELPE